jgi:hypothetical protein
MDGGVEPVVGEGGGEVRGGRGGWSCGAAFVGSPQFVADDLAELDAAGDLADAGDSSVAVDPAEVDDHVDGAGDEEVGRLR